MRPRFNDMREQLDELHDEPEELDFDEEYYEGGLIEVMSLLLRGKTSSAMKLWRERQEHLNRFLKRTEGE